MDVYNISNLLAIIGALVVLVNILTEVIKKVTWDRLPTNIVALILSEGLTLAAGRLTHRSIPFISHGIW